MRHQLRQIASAVPDISSSLDELFYPGIKVALTVRHYALEILNELSLIKLSIT